MIPTIMCVDVRNSRNERVRLFLPVIIAWVLALVLLIAAFPFVLVASLVTAGRGPGFRLLRFYPVFFETVFALSGLRIDIAQRGNAKVFIAFT
jgi:hypothetical protein